MEKVLQMSRKHCGKSRNCLLQAKAGLVWERINSLPNNISDWSKLKAYAHDNIIATKKLKLVFGKVENIVGKGENAGYLIPSFSPFPTLFSKTSCTELLKVDCVVKI